MMKEDCKRTIEGNPSFIDPSQKKIKQNNIFNMVLCPEDLF